MERELLPMTSLRFFLSSEAVAGPAAPECSTGDEVVSLTPLGSLMLQRVANHDPEGVSRALPFPQCDSTDIFTAEGVRCFLPKPELNSHHSSTLFQIMSSPG